MCLCIIFVFCKDLETKCGLYGFIDPELPSKYYKDLLYKMYVENNKCKGKTSKVSGKEEPNKQLVKMNEELIFINSRLNLLSRVVVFLSVVIAYCMI